MPVPWTSDCSAPRRSNGLNSRAILSAGMPSPAEGAWTVISRSAASGPIRSTVSLTTSSTSTGSGDSDRLPVSMREMSAMGS
jgi:hypothetical protein